MLPFDVRIGARLTSSWPDGLGGPIWYTLLCRTGHLSSFERTREVYRRERNIHFDPENALFFSFFYVTCWNINEMIIIQKKRERKKEEEWRGTWKQVFSPLRNGTQDEEHMLLPFLIDAIHQKRNANKSQSLRCCVPHSFIYTLTQMNRLSSVQRAALVISPMSWMEVHHLSAGCMAMSRTGGWQHLLALSC